MLWLRTLNFHRGGLVSIPVEPSGEKCVNARGFPPSISVFPCQYHSTNAPRSSSSTRRFYQKDKRATRGNLPKSKAFSEIGQHFIRKSAFTFYIILLESSSMVSVLIGVFRSFCLSLRRNAGKRLQVGDRNRNSSSSSDDYPCALHTV
jgi:hypothetical protein